MFRLCLQVRLCACDRHFFSSHSLEHGQQDTICGIPLRRAVGAQPSLGLAFQEMFPLMGGGFCYVPTTSQMGYFHSSQEIEHVCLKHLIPFPSAFRAL